VEVTASDLAAPRTEVPVWFIVVGLVVLLALAAALPIALLVSGIRNGFTPPTFQSPVECEWNPTTGLCS